MTAAAQAPARPPKPRPSLLAPTGLVLFAAITWWAAHEELGIDFNVGELMSNLTRGADILAEFFPPNWGFVPRTVEPMIETFAMAVLAGLMGCALALPVAFLASRVTAPGPITYAIDRGLMSVVRALPDILYALVFVAALGIGPLPGILALIFFNVGVVAKLLSETIDGIDQGPIEAARASGANRLQTVRWAVLPQVLPNYVAYSLYAFELNVRASFVIGIVGAGGIGNLLNAERRFFNYDNLTVIVIEIFVFVMLIEFVSIWLRRRLV